MHSPHKFRFSVRGLLAFCLGVALLVANLVPRHHEELELDAATLRRVQHSCLPLNPTDPVSSETFSDVTTKGWPAMACLSHRNPFSRIAAELSGQPLETHESYIDKLGVAINAILAVMVLVACYLTPVAVSYVRHGRSLPGLVLLGFSVLQVFE